MTFLMGIQFFLKFLVVLPQVTISKCTKEIVDYQQQFFFIHSAYSYNTYVEPTCLSGMSSGDRLS